MPPAPQLIIEQAISRAKKAAKRGNLAVAQQLYQAVLHSLATRLQLRAYVSCKNSCHAINPYIEKQTDEDVMVQIVKDGIHILIDLQGHTGRNRLPVLCISPHQFKLAG